MSWEIDSDKPIFKQLMDIIQIKIITGEYSPGEKIPSVRELASIAKVNPNTMQKALSELEQTNLIITQKTTGRFITQDEKLIKECKNLYIQEICKDFLEETKKLCVTDDEIIQTIKHIKKEMEH